MNILKKLTFVFVALVIQELPLKAENAYYLDFKYILNQSTAGKGAQDFLKNKLSKGIKSLKEREKSLQNEEKEIIKQRKVTSAEDYKKKSNRFKKQSFKITK